MKKFFVFMLLFFIPFSVFSATQGTPGSKSQGTVLITLTLGKVARISSLNDITISYTPGVDTGDKSAFSSACVYTNTTNGSYTVKATSSNASSNVMYVVNTTTSSLKIPYTASWFTNSGATGGSGTALTNGTTSATLTGASTTSTSCSGNPNSSIQVTFLSTDLESAIAGSYTDTLTLLVSPV